MLLESDIPVKEIMSTSIIGISPDDPADIAARRMSRHDVGNLIVMEDKKAIGIVTEEDFVRKIVAKNFLPRSVKIRDIMTSSLITISPNADVISAMEIMFKRNIRRLPVVSDGELVGIITFRDILSISPELNRILIDMIKINDIYLVERKKEKEIIQGKCDKCGSFSQSLNEYDGMLICDDCYDALF
ncbi:MAG: CBS domain-containing protein [Candidatus Methanoliparum thermophilum]|uniref:CBS domain-containing protein n=1 Tax=Methanoliparum thermophilum TaxID=2491083 RepID=A0A520KS34_METT2|nr:CBS domain-containing protein [Candidatus Methanoliparum sp. LAM-1]RZN64022.1 MAG: CBS domain-containing protein [Candidatus Methanoliparum thermophilum]BDC35724.1 histidine kinase [Candidatus Methanoliparum sp. LAM-1]